MRRFLILVGLSGALLIMAAPLGAHDLPTEPIIEARIQPVGDALNVDVQVPIAGLADADLPRDDESRRLVHPDVDPVLLIAGRELANSLAFAQADQPLSAPAITTTIAPDELSVVFHLRYQWHPDGGPLSARLHTVRAAPRPLRMTAQFVAVEGTPRTFSITGAPERVVFEPGAGSVASHFVGQGVRALLGGGDYLLMLLCLAAPLRSRRDLRLATLALIAGHAAGLLWGAGTLQPSIASAAPTVALTLAASAVVVAAILNVSSDRSAGLRPVAVAAGLFSGLALGSGLREHAAFAGSHPLIGVGSFLATTSIGMAWLAALLASALDIVRQRGLPERVGAIALSVYAAHTALHHFTSQATLLADSESWMLSHLGTVVVGGWMLIALIVAGMRARRGGAIGAAALQRS